MTQRTQNPPPLKACRFDSDLGHHVNSCFMHRRPIALRRIGLSMCISLLAPVRAIAHSLHKKSAADNRASALVIAVLLVP
jgi:hypothetical protein